MITINAKIRKKQGKGTSRRLRKNNKIPAVLYGKHESPISIELNHDEIFNQENKPEFYALLTLILNEKEIKVKIQAIQRHPFKPKLSHIDFLRL